MKVRWRISSGLILTLTRKSLRYLPGEFNSISPMSKNKIYLKNANGKFLSRGAGFTFGSSVVKHFLARNNMSHILRAHQLCMEGFSVLYDNRLSTVWSAPNYCYRCGNMASILEVGPGGTKHFNTFEAAPENERDGPAQAAEAAQAAHAAQSNGEVVKVSVDSL